MHIGHLCCQKQFRRPVRIPRRQRLIELTVAFLMSIAMTAVAGCWTVSDDVVTAATRTLPGQICNATGVIGSDRVFVGMVSHDVDAIDVRSLDVTQHIRIDLPHIYEIAVNSKSTLLACAEQHINQGVIEVRSIPDGGIAWSKRLRDGGNISDLAFCGQEDWLIVTAPGESDYGPSTDILVCDAATGDVRGALWDLEVHRQWSIQLATSGHDNCFAVKFDDGMFRAWEFDVAGQRIIFQELPELAIDNVNCISNGAAGSPNLWISLNDECRVLSWKERRFRSLPLTHALELYRIADLGGELGAVGVSKEGIFLLREENGSLTVKRVGSRDWIHSVLGVGRGGDVFVYGARKIGVMKLVE